MKTVWVFNSGGQFPSGIFLTQAGAEEWIARHQLSGCLTLYPVDEGVYDSAIRNGRFTPKGPEQEGPKFIAKFSDGSTHHHYEEGQRNT